MEILGRVHNGVVVFDGQPSLPEGAVVAVTYPARVTTETKREGNRVEFPLVRSGVPGSLDLTNERIQQILAEEEIEALKAQWNVPS